MCPWYPDRSYCVVGNYCLDSIFPSEAQMTRIEIEVNEIGVGYVVIDGKDISNHISAFVLEARVGELTRFKPEYLLVAGEVRANKMDALSFEQEKDGQLWLAMANDHIRNLEDDIQSILKEKEKKP